MTGVYVSKKNNNTTYYRASFTYKNKHISIGSYDTMEQANKAYLYAKYITENEINVNDYSAESPISFEKFITILNYKINNIYFKNPIYLYKSFFIYYLSPADYYKFDVDDLFYYSNHKIMKRGSHLFVSDYGMQVNVLSRYGIKNYAMLNKDYYFLNGDCKDFRYNNIKVINKYYGVSLVTRDSHNIYIAKIHINGNYIVGRYSTETEAAIAYNKAIDILEANGLIKNFQKNYIDNLSEIEYSKMYNKIRINKKIKQYKTAPLQ